MLSKLDFYDLCDGIFSFFCWVFAQKDTFLSLNVYQHVFCWGNKITHSVSKHLITNLPLKLEKQEILGEEEEKLFVELLQAHYKETWK